MVAQNGLCNVKEKRTFKKFWFYDATLIYQGRVGGRVLLVKDQWSYVDQCQGVLIGYDQKTVNAQKIPYWDIYIRLMYMGKKKF